MVVRAYFTITVVKPCYGGHFAVAKIGKIQTMEITASVVAFHLVRVLFVWARSHPNVGYRQGMHEILAPLLFEMYLDRKYAPCLSGSGPCTVLSADETVGLNVGHVIAFSLHLARPLVYARPSTPPPPLSNTI
ncbi:TBC1 domain family member 5 homolog A [Eumeta japonica]|uniref:TBC1 domain family member 5 homolog A n=1 Tax=Eumeta variegata TaxID=151549 RepID=A0A4C1ZPS0_EUMVA|nr:TBC1 domain family member 5 homolog A [Eumeta japonica]